ncbi:MAG: Type II secretion system protein E [Candidatus Dependentiae bacterium ADurb.Bin331]|nr:MAG: Type II secretion system protein E [Candidatus Dependentiae bacterium ADurb.Bin331]
MAIKKNLNEILIEQGVLNAQQLQEAQTAAQSAGQTLINYLKENKLITPAALAQAYATFIGVEYVTKITEKMADPALLAKVPLRFLRKNLVIPLIINDRITVVTANPLEYQPIDELTMLLGEEILVAVSTSDMIIDAINRYYPLEGTKQMIEELGEEKGAPEAVDFAEIEDKDILSMATEAPIIKLVNHILVQAVKRGASDIHIEPFEKEVRVRYRIDGVMYNAFNPPKRVQAALTSRIKIMANLNIAEKRIPQDGRIEIKVADKAIDIRVSVLPVTFGERIVLRLLDKSRTFAKLRDLGFSDRDYQVIERSIERPNGIIFVSGPTGSGKTSTLYAILSQLNTPDVNIVTVEDPVEYQMPGIGQVQVREKIGLTFAAALRSILRQDPDIVMIGEIRDQETAQIAIQAALTGHLVLSTIHTNNAPATITRLLDMGVEPYLIASSVVSILAQRLVRTLCPLCKKKYKPTPEEIESLGITQAQADTITFYQAVGCEECGNTGYKGRIAIFEVMEMTNEIAKLTMERADMALIRKEAIAQGMTMLVQDGLRKIKMGITTIQEVIRVAAAEEEMVE